VILAGGSGTRFWPRSRRAHAKQVLALDGDKTMIQQTLERLLPLAAPSDVWVITNKLLSAVIEEQLPQVPHGKILGEPAARNTAPACALAAFLLEPTAPDIVIGIFPSDHVIRNNPRFTEVIRAGVKLAASGERIVVLGVPPTRAETGYGYIELGDAVDAASVPCGDVPVRRVKRFTESRTRPRRRRLLLPETTHGTAVSSYGVRARLPMPFASMCLQWPRRYRRLQRPMVLRMRSLSVSLPSSIRNARTSASTTRCWNRAQPRAR
jgi:mannose-1-phosphate guanylyltransferase